jgi:ABC-type methionine transport system ATPase subunit
MAIAGLGKEKRLRRAAELLEILGLADRMNNSPQNSAEEYNNE